MKLLINLKNNKLIFASFISVFAIITVFYSVLTFLNYKKIYQDFYRSVKIDFYPQDLGHLKVTKFPLPVIRVDNIIQQEKIELKNLEISFSFLSILTFKPEIKNLKIGSVKIYLHNSDFQLVNHEQIIAELIRKNGIDIDTDIKELILINPVTKDKIVIKNFSLSTEKQNRIFSGELQELGKFSGYFKNKADEVDFQFNLSNSNYTLNINETYKNFAFFVGRGDLKIQNIIRFANDNLSELDFILSKNSSLGPVDITFNIQKENELIKLSEIKFASGWLRGNGDLSINKNSSLPMNLNIKLEQINLSSSSSTQTENNSNNFNNNKSFTLPTSGIIAEILIDQITLVNGEKINDVKFISDVDKNNILIKDFSGKIASGGSFTLNGKITSNSFRSILDGTLNLQHKDINLLSQALGFNDPSLSSTPFS